MVYLYGTLEEARRGDANGATGFLVGVPGVDDPFVRWRYGGHMAQTLNSRRMRSVFGSETMHFLYAVTAAHVVAKGGTVVRLNVPGAAARPLDLPPEAWLIHPSADVALCPIGVDQMYPENVSYIPIHYAITKEQLPFIGAGDDAFFVGRFRDLDGRERNTPTARFGNLSIRTVEPVYSKGWGRYEDSFVVEMRSLSGYSGSPVFTYSGSVSVEFTSSDIEDRADAEFEPITEVYLLGVDWSHMQDPDEGFHTGMMGVVPAWKIVELLQDEGISEMQKETKQKLEADPNKTTAMPDWSESDDEVSFTRGDFLADLEKAAKRTKNESERT